MNNERICYVGCSKSSDPCLQIVHSSKSFGCSRIVYRAQGVLAANKACLHPGVLLSALSSSLNDQGVMLGLGNIRIVD